MNLIEKNYNGEKDTFIWYLNERNFFDFTKFDKLLLEIKNIKNKNLLFKIIHLESYIKKIFISNLWNELNNEINEIKNINKDSDVFFDVLEKIDDALYNFVKNNKC